MPTGDSPQGMYAPLSQNMTDSESEDEIHIHNHHSHLTHHLRSNTNHMGPMIEIGTANYSHFHSDGDDRIHHNETTSDTVAIINGQDVDKDSGPMSPLRKFCFVLSLLACVLTVVIFLWVIPCSDDRTCPAAIERTKTHNWIKNYEKIEFKGQINVVDTVWRRGRNLVFMYRGDGMFNVSDDFNKKRNGIIALIGGTGEVAWFVEMVNEPSSIDCTLIDQDLNGSPDCLIMDEFGEVLCINPISGQWRWHITEHTSRKADLLNFPLVLPDLNGDKVNELLLVTVSKSGAHNRLLIVSGSDGKAIGSSYVVKECFYIHKFQLDPSFMIGFNCINNETEQQKFKSLTDLYKLTTNKIINSDKLTSPKNIPQHKFYGQRRDTERQRSIYTLGGKQLVVENLGKCPSNCNVTVTLTERKNGKDHIIKNFSGSRMYGMVPAQLSFQRSARSKEKIHGFVIKFWEWSMNETTSSTTKDRTKRETEYNMFSNILVRQSAWVLPSVQKEEEFRSRQKKSANIPNAPKESMVNMKMRLLKETVVLLVFNSTYTRIENTSQSNIIQFCQEGKTGAACQPDLNYQENSLLIADFDRDNSQELVSYYSTFVKTDGGEDEWKLLTYVQLLRLESELPSFYSSGNKN